MKLTIIRLQSCLTDQLGAIEQQLCNESEYEYIESASITGHP